MSIIKVRSITKRFRIAEKITGVKGTFRHFFFRRMSDVVAVDQIDFNIDQGEIVGFIGSNGAGKTTTLKMLCGLIHPTKGTIQVAGYLPVLRE